MKNAGHWNKRDSKKMTECQSILISPNEYHMTAMDGLETPVYDMSWTSLLRPDCDYWFKNDVQGWVRVNAILWNKSCDCPKTRVDEFDTRSSGKCAPPPFVYIPTKYLQLSFYKTDNTFIKFIRAWGRDTSAASQASASTPANPSIVLNAPTKESDTIQYMTLSRVSASTSLQLIIYLNSGSTVTYVCDGVRLPSTTNTRAVKFDYVDIYDVEEKKSPQGLYFLAGGVIALSAIVFLLVAHKTSKPPTPKSKPPSPAV